MFIENQSGSNRSDPKLKELRKYIIALNILGILILSSSFVYLNSTSFTIQKGVVFSSWYYQNQNQQNTGYSPQTALNPSNVGALKPLWATHVPFASGTPVVVNGTVFVTGILSIWALNKFTGAIIWVDSPFTGLTRAPFFTQSGVTVDNGNVFVSDANNYLYSLNAQTGAMNWKSLITQNVVGSIGNYSGAEATPLVYNGKVIVGETYGDYAVRGLLRAFDENTGSLLWTFYTVPPGPINATNQVGYQNSLGQNTWGTNGTYGCICGGGAVWNVPAVDPNTGIIYFGTGNPDQLPNNASGVAARTPGYPNSQYSNLYTDSVIALDSANGKLVWYYQAVPGDQTDYDFGMPVQLFTTTINGVQTEVVGAMNKIGNFYVMKAQTGALVYKVKLAIQQHTNDTAGTVPDSARFPGMPDSFSSYNPITNMIYVTGYNGPYSCGEAPSCAYPRNSTLYAIDASTGGIAWQMYLGQGFGGGVSSSNTMVFTSDGNHTLYALNAWNGAILWQHYEPTGGNAGVIYWSWGPPSIMNGMIYFTTMGSYSNGLVEDYATF